MLIYNITFLVADTSLSRWLSWVKNQHIPNMLSSGSMSKPQLAKILNENGQEGTSFSVQFHVGNMAILEEWHQKHAQALQQECSRLFGEEVLFFATVLELESLS